MPAKWIDSSQELFKSDIRITGIDNLGLVSEITQLISDSLHVNMQNLNFKAEGGTFTGEITVVVKNKAMIKTLIERLKKIEGIEKVSRI